MTRRGGWQLRGERRYVRVRTAGGRRVWAPLSGCSSDEEADSRAALIAEVASQLVAGGRHDKVKPIAMALGAAKTETAIASIRRGVKERLKDASAPLKSITFAKFAEQWTSGELHRRYPDHVRTKDARDDLSKLTSYINPLVGTIPLVSFQLDDADYVMRKLPDHLGSITRRHVAQIMYRIMRMAVYPARIIPVNPLPTGFLPKTKSLTAKQFLYPAEDAALLSCTEVPFRYRLCYGFMAREGLRPGEAVGSKKDKTDPITWNEFDLVNGVVRLDENKTDDPRSWALSPGVVRALSIVKEKMKGDPFEGVSPNRIAPLFRVHLEAAGITRPELFERTKSRRPIRFHDLRATFVTVALALGKTEAWVMDRTGHRSSAMVHKYRRTANQFVEVGAAKELLPLDEAIPELAPGWAKSGLKDSKNSQQKGGQKSDE